MARREAEWLKWSCRNDFRKSIRPNGTMSRLYRTAHERGVQLIVTVKYRLRHCRLGDDRFDIGCHAGFWPIARRLARGFTVPQAE